MIGPNGVPKKPEDIIPVLEDDPQLGALLVTDVDVCIKHNLIKGSSLWFYVEPLLFYFNLRTCPVLYAIQHALKRIEVEILPSKKTGR